MAEIGRFFGVRYMTVSRVVRKSEDQERGGVMGVGMLDPV